MSDAIKVVCPHCDGTLTLKDRSAEGKKVRCPKCQEAFRVELPPVDDDLDMLDDIDDLNDDEGDDFEAPRRSKKSQGATGSTKKSRRKGAKVAIPWLPIGIGAFVLLFLGGAGYLLSNLSFPVSNKIDLSYLPPDANVVMHIKVQELFSSPLLQHALNQPAAQQMLNQPSQAMGTAVRDVKSVTVGMVIQDPTAGFPGGNPALLGGRRTSSTTPSKSVTVVRNTTPLDPEVIAVKNLGRQRVELQGKAYYRPTKPDQLGGMSMYFPEPNVMILATEQDLTALIQSGVREHRRAEFDLINPAMTIAFCATSPTPANRSTLTAPDSQPGLQALERALNKSGKDVAFGARIQSQIDIEMLTQCADSAGAAEVKSACDGVIAEWKTQFEQSKTLLAMMQMSDLVGLGDKTLSSVNIAHSGSQVNIRATIPAEVEQVAQKLAGMAASGRPGSNMPLIPRGGESLPSRPN